MTFPEKITTPTPLEIDFNVVETLAAHTDEALVLIGVGLLGHGLVRAHAERRFLMEALRPVADNQAAEEVQRDIAQRIRDINQNGLR